MITLFSRPSLGLAQNQEQNQEDASCLHSCSENDLAIRRQTSKVLRVEAITLCAVGARRFASRGRSRGCRGDGQKRRVGGFLRAFLGFAQFRPVIYTSMSTQQHAKHTIALAVAALAIFQTKIFFEEIAAAVQEIVQLPVLRS